MRKLPQYTDRSLTGSIFDKGATNPLYPEFSEIFANIQVATPVSETVLNSPWLTFKDDLIMAAARKAVGALPPNLETTGAGSPPDGDYLGHSFTKAYARKDESRGKLLELIKSSKEKLRYPIAYFDSALLIENSIRTDDIKSESIRFRFVNSAGKDVGSTDEERLESGVLVKQRILDCFALRAGEYQIEAETIVDHHNVYAFSFPIWKAGAQNREKETPVRLEIKAGRGIKRWRLGTLRVTKGSQEEPLQIITEIYKVPQRKD